MDVSGTATQSSTTGTTFPLVNGWTCGQCGQWVPNGTTHQCWAYQTTPAPLPVTIYTPRLSDEDVNRIARRVVEMLKEADN